MSILQSIKPQYCELIARGIKEYELRKTKPNIPTPFKVHIYETKDKKFINMAVYEPNNNIKFEHAPGKVIAEYICDEMIEWTEDMRPPVPLSKICLSYSQIRKYGGNKTLYLWHISDLKIHDKSKELSEFQRACNHENCGKCKRPIIEKLSCTAGLNRPPQSWCYVEEVG